MAAIPHIARYFLSEVATPPKWCNTPLALSFASAHDTPCCDISHDTCAISHKTSIREFCDTIVTSVARYETYHCWASKVLVKRQSLCPALSGLHLAERGTGKQGYPHLSDSTLSLSEMPDRQLCCHTTAASRFLSRDDQGWVLFRPTFLSVKNSCVFVLCDLTKTD